MVKIEIDVPEEVIGELLRKKLSEMIDVLPPVSEKGITVLKTKKKYKKRKCVMVSGET